MSFSRHILLSVLPLACAVADLRAQDFVSTVLATKPLAYWRLDSPGQPSLVNGYSLTEVGIPTYGEGAPIGLSGKSLSITGNNSAPQYAITGLSGGIPGTGSMMAWVKLSQLPSAQPLFRVIAGESQNGNDFDIAFQNDNRIYFYTGAGENTSFLPNTATLANQWHLVIATYVGGSQGSRSIYWDGNLASTFSGAVNAAPKTSQFSIGYSLVFTGRDFDGLIDEVAVWNRALNSSEVTAIYKAATASTAGPSIQNAVPSFIGNAGFSPNMYMEIYGSGFTDHTRTWAGSDFIGSNAPASLDGVSVSVNGKPAYVYFISPGQINVNLPDDASRGPVAVQVKGPGGASNSYTVTLADASPALQTVPQFLVGQRQYVVAQKPDFSSFIGRPGMVAGLNFTLPRPGDTITIYALGCGATAPASPAGVVAEQLAPLALPYGATIGGVPALVSFAGIVPGSIGLYQINITIPAVAAGDQPIQLTVGGMPNAQNLFIPIGQ